MRMTGFKFKWKATSNCSMLNKTKKLKDIRYKLKCPALPVEYPICQSQVTYRFSQLTWWACPFRKREFWRKLELVQPYSQNCWTVREHLFVRPHITPGLFMAGKNITLVFGFLMNEENLIFKNIFQCKHL